MSADGNHYAAVNHWMLSTRPDDAGCGALVGRPLKEADVEPGLPISVEAVTWHSPESRPRHFRINHGSAAAPLPQPAHDVLTRAVTREVPPGRCAVPRGHRP
ncbi:hypothetical protein [Streptomyces sp. NPDC097610]|uniref:hypothetical protein n=1 Tax=Streptomyces sp. NPDC097610 TaxID=3157227 RepID=UPI003322ECB4